MPAQLSWFLADGATPAPAQLDFGYVGPGQQSAPQTVLYRNTGDAAATNAELVIATVGATDLESWLTAQHGADSATLAAPVALGTIAPGEEGTVILILNVPADAVLSSRPLLAQPGIFFDLVT